MNILFLDDDGFRCGQFSALNPSAKIARSSEECIKLLPTQDWNFVFLDHDLGYTREGEDTGMKVAQWIAANNPKIEIIILHSFNSVGVRSMVACLKNYNVQVIPFNSKMRAYVNNG